MYFYGCGNFQKLGSSCFVQHFLDLSESIGLCCFFSLYFSISLIFNLSSSNRGNSYFLSSFNVKSNFIGYIRHFCLSVNRRMTFVTLQMVHIHYASISDDKQFIYFDHMAYLVQASCKHQHFLMITCFKAFTPIPFSFPAVIGLAC